MEPWQKKEHKQAETAWHTSTKPDDHPKINVSICTHYVKKVYMCLFYKYFSFKIGPMDLRWLSFFRCMNIKIA